LRIWLLLGLVLTRRLILWLRVVLPLALLAALVVLAAVSTRSLDGAVAAPRLRRGLGLLAPPLTLSISAAAPVLFVRKCRDRHQRAQQHNSGNDPS